MYRYRYGKIDVGHSWVLMLRDGPLEKWWEGGGGGGGGGGGVKFALFFPRSLLMKEFFSG